MRVNDDFLGSSSGRRMHYDINETIDDIEDEDHYDQDLQEEEAPPVIKKIPDRNNI